MTTYLIDSENTGPHWDNYAKSLTTGDVIALYYIPLKSNPNVPIPAGLLDMVYARNATLEIIKCIAGASEHSILDMQLASDLGQRIAKNPKAGYVIVSMDRGFRMIAKYWQRQGMNVTCSSPLEQRDTIDRDAKETKRAKAYYESVFARLRIKGDYVDRIIEIVMNAMTLPKSYRMVYAYRACKAAFPGKEGTKTYNTIRPDLQDIAQNGPFPKLKTETR